MDIDQGFRHKTLTYSIDSVVRSIDRGQIIIDADFKDKKHWSRSDQSLFIESALLSIPTQPIWCEESHFGQFLVIDGTERLRSLTDYMGGRFSLCDLVIKEEYNNKKIGELPFHAIMNIGDGYALQFNIIDYDTHPSLKLEFYKRLNKTDSNFRNQSARNFAYRNALNYLKKIENLNASNIKFMYRPRLRPIYIEGHTSIEETFLRMLHFIDIIEYHAYPNHYGSVDDELDKLSYKIEEMSSSNNNIYLSRLSQRLTETLAKMKIYYQKSITVELTKHIYSSEDFRVDEFYLYFIRALCGKFSPPPKTAAPIAWANPKRKSSSLYSDIERILNA